MLNIVGNRVALGPLRRDLIPVYQRWINDTETARALGSFRPMTTEQETEWYESEAKSEKNIPFTIYERSTLRPIGTAALMDVDHRNRKAEFGIGIGEPDCRSRGYGTETTRLVLDYAVEVVGLHNIMLGVFEFNRAAVRAYEKPASKRSAGAGRATSRVARCGTTSGWTACPRSSRETRDGGSTPTVCSSTGCSGILKAR